MTYPLLITLIAMAVPAFAEIEGEVHAGYPTWKMKSGKEVVFTNLFNDADANGDHMLGEEEFGHSYGASERPVVTEYRFNELSEAIINTGRAIVIEERVIYLDAFIEFNGGRKLNPGKFEIFDLADDNDDNVLTPLEFFDTRVRSASNSRSSFKAFIKLDTNDDNLISISEWGGITVL